MLAGQREGFTKGYWMRDAEILDKEIKKSDELLMYKMGRRSRPQIRRYLLRVMKKAREQERAKIKEEQLL